MYQELIDHIRKFVALTDAEAEVLPGYIQVHSIKKKAYLLKEGQVCRWNYFVGKGCLRMFCINEKGTEQITQFGIENWWLSDYMSFDRQTASGFNIQAIEDAEVYAIAYEQQAALFTALPQMESYFRIVFQKAYAAWQVRLKYLYDFSKEENYLHFTGSFPGFVQRIPQYMLASYLGFTPEYLSELRKKHT